MNDDSNKNKPQEHTFTFDHSFWSFDGFENDEEGIPRPINLRSPYID